MTIQMIRGYSTPPPEGGANYSGTEFGYTFVTQEGEGHSEPADDAFAPTEHWDGYGEDHPYLPKRIRPGLLVPGPLGQLDGCCNHGCQMGDVSDNKTTLLIGAGLLAAGLMFFSKKSKRSRRRGR